MKKILFNILLVIIYFHLHISHAQAVDCLTYFISPSGNDSNPGTELLPLKSLEYAKHKIRTIVSSGSHKIVVYIRGGTYFLTNPLEFTSLDTGTSTVSWESYPGESPMITGGKRLTGTWVGENSNIWGISAAAVLDSAGDVRQLFKNGERVKQSRFPFHSTSNRLTISNVSTDKKTITFNDSYQLPSSLGNSAEVVNFIHFLNPIIPISTSTSKSITLKNRGQFPNPAGVNLPYDLTENRDTSIIQNIPLEYSLDQNVWEFDKVRKAIRLQSSGVDPNSQEFIVPTTDQLLLIKGAKNLTFTGLKFSYAKGWTANTYPDGKYFLFTQGGLIVDNKDLFYEKTHWPPSVIDIKDSENINFFNNQINKSGGIGMMVTGVTKNITIDSNTFTDLGNSCLTLGDFQSNIFPQNIAATNNTLHNCGVLNPGIVGLFVAYIQNSNISNNTVYDLPYSGFNIGWWSAIGISNNLNNTISKNKISDVCKLMFDCGGIYTLGFNKGSKIIGNLISDVRVHPQSAAPINMGLYFDANSGGFEVNDNMIWNTNPNYYIWFQTYVGAEAKKSDFLIGNNYTGVAPNQNSDIFVAAGAKPTNHYTSPSSCTPSPITILAGDLNGDGKVNVYDFVKLLNGFNTIYFDDDFVTLLTNYGK